MANGSRAIAEVQQAADFLKGLPREWSGTSDHDCKTYEDKNIDRLSKPFAVSAASGAADLFLRAYAGNRLLWRRSRAIPLERHHATRQARQRNMDGLLNVARLPFSRGPHIEHPRRLASLEDKMQFLDPKLRKLLRLRSASSSSASTTSFRITSSATVRGAKRGRFRGSRRWHPRPSMDLPYSPRDWRARRARR
jgi:hypothetical protein